jgi:glycosyltransferase involved in cell wall biosynthesis
MASVAIIHNHPIHYKHLLFCELAKKGMDFEVLFTGGSSGNRIETPLPEDHQYRYSFAYSGAYEQAPKAQTVRSVWRALNRIRPRVVIIGGYYDVAAWTGWLWAGFNRKGRILWAESNVFDHQRSSWKETLKRWFVSKCDCAHVYGASNREYLERLGMPPEKIYIKRAVANTALFLSDPPVQSQKPDHITLIYCGRFSPEKNLPMLLRAFAGVEQNKENPRLTLKLVGYGPLENSLRQLADALGIAKAVDFVGKAHQTELPQIFRTADAMVLPSICEPWGLVVNEAMLSGLPVAVSDKCGCAADLVRPGTGWSFSPYDEAGLTRLLSRIAATPREDLEKMGRAARLLAAEYSPENCAAIVMKTVAELLERRSQQHISASAVHSQG